MSQNIKKLTILAIMSLFYCQIVYSQQTVLNNNGDTLICVNKNKYAFLIKSVFKVSELKELNNVNENIISSKDSIIENNIEIIKNKDDIINNKDDIITYKNEQINILENKLSEAKKETQKQKFYKWVSISVGAISTTFVSYLYFKK